MNLIIDIRESKLITLYENNNINYEKKQLDLGDVQINNSNNTVLVFERKTLNDLLSSIVDGRYNEQSFRLDACPVLNHNIYYIIEGDIERYKDKEKSLYTKNTIYSCIYSLTYKKGFSVLLSQNINQTYTLINKIYNKLCKEPVKSNENHENHENNYLNSMKISKKSNLTPENIGMLFLAQIPGVSKNSAEKVFNFCNVTSIGQLIILLNTDKSILEKVRYLNEKGKEKKLTKTVIENINKYLL